MDALHSPPPATAAPAPAPAPAAAAASTGEESMLSCVKKSCLSFTVSMQEGFGYVKAFFVGQGKRITARNEKEATAAYLLTAKMQVEATDAAEESKKRIESSS